MVNIDTVYQTVQALANKEQRGYITPQEFNLLANQVQQDIFEQYFYDMNAFRAERPLQYELGNSVNHILEKIEPWYQLQPLLPNGVLPAGRVGKLWFGHGMGPIEMKLITPQEIQNMRRSQWFHMAPEHNVFYTESAYKVIQAYRRNTLLRLEPMGGLDMQNSITVETVVGQPSLCYWGYTVVNEEAVYDPTKTVHFELDSSEQADIVIKILKLAGISIEDPSLYQPAAAEEQQNIQQESK